MNGITTRQLLYGIGLAFLLLIPAALVSNHLDSQGEIPVNIHAYDWDADSLLELSKTMDDRIPQLLYMRIVSYDRDDGMSTPITASPVGEQQTDIDYYDDTTEEWLERTSYPVFPLRVSSQGELLDESINVTAFSGISSGLATVLSDDTTLDEIDLETFQDERDAADEYTRITHIYNDGFEIELYIQASQVLVHYQFLHSISVSTDGTAFGTVAGSCSSCIQNVFTYRVDNIDLDMAPYWLQVDTFLESHA